MTCVQRIELLLFSACFLAFAYFNQGGGWNQNARFAEVRAMAEQGRFAIDDYLVYKRDTTGEGLVRLPVRDATYTSGGEQYRLCWVDMVWNLYPVGDHPLPEGVKKAPMVEEVCSGDIAYVSSTGHFHPNKPPGTSLIALPGYFLLLQVERLLGIDPDNWWVLTLNAWLTSVCSVGVLSALGCVLFFRLALAFSGGAMLPALLTTLAFAFGTTFFPFGTIMFDHNLTAALLIAAFYCLWRVRAAAGEASGRTVQWLAVLAGICAGMAAVTNYMAAVAGIFLGLYALLRGGRGQRTYHWRTVLFYSLGVVGPFLLICWYGWVCYGSPFRLSTDFQNPLFKDAGGAFLGMFPIPRHSDDLFRIQYVAALLLFSPFRGLFYLSPVLVFGVIGAFLWLRRRQHVAEARLCLAIFGFFYVFNALFNGYHSGFSAGPRYLIAGIPFLALPMVACFAHAKWRWPAALLGVVSIVFQLILTATDGQNPTGVGGHARVEGKREEWSYNLLADYAWPLLAHERAWPLLEEQLALHMEGEEARLADEIDDPQLREQRAEAMRRELRESIERGEPSPFLLASVRGPVSVNPVGIFEGLFTYSFFPPSSRQTQWASFNLGEFLWPHSLWSLLPLLLLSGGLCGYAVRLAVEERSPAPGG